MYFKVALWMITFRSLCSNHDMSTVTAFPYLHFALFQNTCAVSIFFENVHGISLRDCFSISHTALKYVYLFPQDTTHLFWVKQIHLQNMRYSF